MGGQIKIGLVDDHVCFRQALKITLLQFEHLTILFEAGNGNELFDRLTTLSPDVILLDIFMPEIGGLEVLKILSARFPKIKVVMLTCTMDETYVLEALNFGVNGFLTKYQEIREIVKAIETAYRDEVYVSNLMVNGFLRKYVLEYNKKSFTTAPKFSLEEIRIMKLLSMEKSINEISSDLHLSKRSIELKRDKIKEKANVKTTAGLLLYAFKRGLL
jgi:DNA-binding NarL/FixJ family response regulator